MVAGEAADASSAKEYTRHQMPDLIILDLGLPDQHGYELLQEWRQAGACQPLPSSSSPAALTKRVSSGAELRG